MREDSETERRKRPQSKGLLQTCLTIFSSPTQKLRTLETDQKILTLLSGAVSESPEVFGHVGQLLLAEAKVLLALRRILHKTLQHFGPV